MEKIIIQGAYIQLNQLLKLAGIADNGADANTMIEQGNVKVNGLVEHRKRNKIYPGTVVEIGNFSIMTVSVF
jgi:ribosome-associated protein